MMTAQGSLLIQGHCEAVPYHPTAGCHAACINAEQQCEQHTGHHAARL